MKKKNKQGRIKARFAPETRFDAGKPLVVPNRGAMENALDDLKARLLDRALADPEGTAAPEHLQLAATEAAGLAWFTPFPLLVFPALLEEKLYAARRQAARQQLIRDQTTGLIGKATR